MQTLTCVYCGRINAAEERRCGLCGRRLDEDSPQPRPNPYLVARTAALPKAQGPPVAQAIIERRPMEDQPKTPIQESLFSVRELQGEEPKIIDMGRYTGKASRKQSTHRRQTPEGAGSTRGRKPPREMASEQQMLEFPATVPPGRVMESSAESRRVCPYPVAPLTRRSLASAIDMTFVLLVAGLAGLVLRYGPLEGMSFWRAAAWLSGLTAAIAFAYKLTWVLAESDSPGVGWAGLRTIHFDGRPVSKQHRMVRFGAAALTVAAAAFGLWWALWDEERLTIYDHMSSTFLTPDKTEE